MTETYTTIDDEVVFLEYSKAVPFDMKSVFDDCYRKISLEGIKIDSEYLPTALCAMADKIDTPANLDKVASLFRKTHHPPESTIPTSIALFLSILARQDLYYRYELFSKDYPTACSLCSESKDNLTHADIILDVVTKLEINPQENNQQWTQLTD